MSGLQYNINDWHQLSQCQSNLSRELSIQVSDLIQNTMLSGTRISVYHETFGIIFSTMVTPTGTMVSPKANDPESIFTLTPNQILEELYKWGFVVTYSQLQHLPADQLAYLVTLNGLGYDKIRNIAPAYYSQGMSSYTTRTVAFVIAGVTIDWLDNTFNPTMKYYTDAISRGKVIDVGAMSQNHHWDWSWLDTVASISGIISQNGGDGI